MENVEKEDQEAEANKSMETEDFKMPVLPLSNAANKPEQVPKEEKKEEQKLMKSPAEILKERSAPPLQYSEPPWSGMPPEEKHYFLEELKSGTIVKEHKLVGKSHFVIGRLPTNDIQLEHPSLSRYHAVLQYKAEASPDQPKGFYLYDLGSTHGTFHNKNKCFAKTYYRLRVGHGIKAGGSTRLLILQGPQDDMEDENELSMSELKQLAAEKAKLKALEKQKQREEQEEEEEKVPEVTWGMAEDATEEEEQNPDMSKNPFSMSRDEDLHLDDPKKTLRGWFEREGFELNYDCQEKGYANFTCTVDLPINEIMGTSGAPTQAEATVKGGKKKEAVIQCALEACRILNKFGLLRQSNHESRAKKQIKKWKEDDYYDSDEDEFLDRTGNIAAKRQKRMQLEGEIEAKDAAVETYETLLEKQKSVENEVLRIEKELKEAIEALHETKKVQEAENDDLDAYMESLKKTEKGQGGKENVSKLRQVLQTQQNELKRIEKLVLIAKPTQMPQLVKSNAKVMIGKRWGFGSAKNLRTIHQPKMVKNVEEPKEIVAEIQEKKSEPQNPVEPLETNVKRDETPEKSFEQPESISNTEVLEEVVKKKEKKRRPKKHASNPVLEDKSEDMDDQDEVKVPGEYDVSDPKYATWLPPANQSGDGRTSLNDKYGY